MTHVCQVSLSALTGSDDVAYVGEALDGLDGVPDELECLQPLGAASVKIHKCQRARGEVGERIVHSIQIKSLAISGNCHC